MSTPHAESITLEEYLEGIEALQQTEGWKIHQDMERLGWSFYIFQGNYHDLINSLHINYADFLLHFDVRNSPEMQSFLKEVMRKFHNFVASALMLVDHTRNLSDKLYKGTQFEDIYSSEVEKRFKLNPAIQFVHRLRSYVLHCALPEPSAVLSSNFETSLKISISTLRKWAGWTQLARQYLETCNEDEKIEDIACAYFKSVSDFHEWFFNNQKKLHEQAFAEANALRQRLVNSKWHSEYS
ncbi:MAG TPA: hypothetical protein VHE60_10605 [Pyrinomonadaceae bacterium]|nr:hypothetical protein [Pyrinomonadaceae bacterium]